MKLAFRCPQAHDFEADPSDAGAACPECGWLMQESEGTPAPVSAGKAQKEEAE